MGAATEFGDVPQECVYEAGKLVAKRYYKRLAALQAEGGFWSERFFLDGDDPRAELAGTIAVAFDIDAGERPLNVYEALADGSLGLTKAELRSLRGLRCGEVYDTVLTVYRLMPAILDKAENLFDKIMAEGEE